MGKINNKLYLLSLCLLLLLSLSGCKKKVADKPIGFGEGKEVIETSVQESTEDLEKFAMEGNLGGRYDTKETTKSQEQILKEQEEEKESLDSVLESITEEKEKVLGTEISTEANIEETIKSDSGNIEYLEDVGNGLVASMREQIYDGLIDEDGMNDLGIFISENFSNESSEVQQQIHDYITACWHDYCAIQESLANLPPEETWSEEELKKNPNLKNFSRSEYEYIQKVGEEHGVITYENFDDIK